MTQKSIERRGVSKPEYVEIYVAFFFIFVLSSFLKKKQFPIISAFKSRNSLTRTKLQCVTRRHGNFLYSERFCVCRFIQTV